MPHERPTRVAPGKGKLELTWSNKDMRLLSHDDVSYEWVDPSDWRVAEVRLLQLVETVGERNSGNLLVQGDALHALTSLSSVPEYAEQHVGKVKLCYIDPPFNTGESFQHYDDAVEHSVWLTMLRDRLVQIRRLLRSDGSVWVHLDDAEVHRARCVLDEVFGSENFVATIIWEKTTSARNDAKLFSTDQDYLLVYAKDAALFKPRRDPHTAAADKAYKNPDNDPRGPWREVDYKGPKTADERPNLYYPIVHPRTGEEIWPRKERVWAYGRDEHERHIKENLLWWGKTQNYTFPKLKKFLTTRRVEGTPPRTFWKASEVDTTRRAKNEVKLLFPGVVPFATPKPEKLLARVINLASEPGDIVLDCFAGSGTTAAVAHKMGRRWITVELSEANLQTFVRPRLSHVVAGADGGGVTSGVGWTGGGGFDLVAVTQSMFEEVEGTVLLADWVTGGELAETVAAQLKYRYTPEGLYAGKKGRSRLAVLDGMLTVAVADHLIAGLDEKETLLVVAQVLAPGVEEHVRNVRPGSRARKVPRDLAVAGRRPSHLVQLARSQDDVTGD